MNEKKGQKGKKGQKENKATKGTSLQGKVQHEYAN